MSSDKLRSVAFPAHRVSQPIGDFFIGVMSSIDLTQISFADVRRIENEQRDIEKYLGIQRPLKRERVLEIQQYVKTKDAAFPTAIILAVQGVCASWNESEKLLTLAEYKPDSPDEEEIPFNKIAKILDGQHRVAGLADYGGTNFQLNVAIFVDADIAEQANIFATVNLAQTKVNKSLVYDLFELSKTRSPQKTCHNIAVALDSSPNSPLFRRIKRLGVATQGRFTETITQATVVESLLRYISSDPAEDRDRLLRRKKLELADERTLQKYIFRNLFVAEKDEMIVKIAWAYFAAVRKRWPNAWDNLERGNILTKTNGFRALMRLLRPAYLSLAKEVGQEVSIAQFGTVFAKVTLNETDFNVLNFPPGSSGEAALVKRLSADSGIAPR